VTRRVLLLLALWAVELGVCAVSIVGLVHATDVDCLRQADRTYTCSVETLLLGRVPVFRREVREVADVVVEKNDSGDGVSYRAELVTRNGKRYAPSNTWTDYGPANEIAAVVGGAIRSAAPRAHHLREPPWSVLYITGGLTLMTMALSMLVLRRPGQTAAASDG